MPLYVPGIVPVVSALPSNPYDGQQICYEADATNGVYWHLVYRALKADGTSDGSAYKWHFIGGPPLRAVIDASQGTTSATYAALGTAGPSITVPLAGDYDIHIGSRFAISTAGVNGWYSFDVGATGAIDADGSVATGPTANYNVPQQSRRRKTGLAASTAIVAKYKSNGSATATFDARWMEIKPVRVG